MRFGILSPRLAPDYSSRSRIECVPTLREIHRIGWAVRGSYNHHFARRAELGMPNKCRELPGKEVLLNSIIASMLLEQRLRPGGAILDAGAKDGRWACHYASIDPARPIHAMDPDPKNVEAISASGRAWKTENRLPNLIPMHGLLDEHSTNFTVRELRERPLKYRMEINAPPRMRVPAYSIDDLYLSHLKQHRLALAHLDVEGNELSVLRGAERVIRRDRPVIVTELAVHASHTYSRALIESVRRLDYSSFVIEEITGVRADLRNVLHLPREQHARFATCSALNVAVTTHALQAVTPETITAHAFPCCVVGASCCPPGNKARVQCCAHWRVHEWMRAALHNGTDLQFMTRHTWYDQRLLRWRPADELLSLQQQVRARNVSDGFSYFRLPP